MYAGAFSRSVCGRGLSGKPFSTIGFERKFNRALQFTNKQEFVQFMTEDVPPRPEDFLRMRTTNQGHKNIGP